MNLILSLLKAFCVSGFNTAFLFCFISCRQPLSGYYLGALLDRFFVLRNLPAMFFFSFFCICCFCSPVT